MFRNPLVSPDILGASSGASLGAAFAILNGASNWVIQLSAFAGGVIAVAASYLISRKSAHSHTLSLVLTGTMIMSLCNAGVTMIKYIADPNDVLQQITFWLMGSSDQDYYEFFCMECHSNDHWLSMIFIFRWQINLLTLDEEEARSLGINIRKISSDFYHCFNPTQCSRLFALAAWSDGWINDSTSGTRTGRRGL